MNRHSDILISFFVLSVIITTTVAAGNYTYQDVKSDSDANTGREVKRLGDVIRRAVILEDPSEVSIFYSTKDHHMIKEMMPRPWIKPGQSLRLPFIGDPCSCKNSSCGCCVGLNITAFGFDKKACVNVTYEQSLFGIIVDMTVDNQSVLHNVYSAANPPPICIPLVISGVPTGVDFCLRLYQIYLDGFNIHLCIDLEVRIVTAPILVLHFDCVKLGLNGVMFGKPNSTTTVKPSDEDPTSSTTSSSVDGDIFDPVTEMNNATQNTNDINKTNMTLTIIEPLSENSNANMAQSQQENATEIIGENLEPTNEMVNVKPMDENNLDNGIDVSNANLSVVQPSTENNKANITQILQEITVVEISTNVTPNLDPMKEIFNMEPMKENIDSAIDKTNMMLPIMQSSNEKDANMTQILQEITTDGIYANMTQILTPMKDVDNETQMIQDEQSLNNVNAAQIQPSNDIDLNLESSKPSITENISFYNVAQNLTIESKDDNNNINSSLNINVNVNDNNVIHVSTADDYNSAINFLINNFSNLTQSKLKTEDIKTNVNSSAFPNTL